MLRVVFGNDAFLEKHDNIMVGYGAMGFSVIVYPLQPYADMLRVAPAFTMSIIDEMVRI